MSKLRTLTRRTFLVSSVAVAGGVVFGTYALKTPHENPLLANLEPGAATFNPWVRIDRGGITLIVPHADKGQGVASAQAALIAEELDVEFGQFNISFGQPSKAYYNTAVAEDGAPFMATDQSFLANAARDTIAGLAKLMGMQFTGGSTAMLDSFDKLRAAGASARETLKLAASQRRSVPIADLRTQNGSVILPDGTAIPYTDLAAEAAAIPAVQNVKLRGKDQWRLIGKPMQRLDTVAKSTGRLTYGIDVKVDGMLHAAVRLNPHKSGGAASYDPAGAFTYPGVEQVLEISDGFAVIAKNSWTAIQGANALDVTWNPSSYPAEQDDHWAALAASFDADHLDRTWRDEGDVEADLAGADAITAEYRSPYVAHAPLEPLNAIVLVSDDQVEVWTGHQMQTTLVQKLAAVTGHDVDQIILHNQFIGGSFGHRLEFAFVMQATEIANQLRGTPIKMTYSREVDFAQDFPRHIAMGRGRGRVANGQVQAMDIAIASPSVLGSQFTRAGMAVPGPDAQIVAGAWNNPYRLPHLRVAGYRAPELAPVSSWRSVGAVGAGFIFDTFLDELIHAAGADPMAERIRLMAHDRSRKVLETVADMCDWGSPLAPNQGRGVAFVESFGVPVAEVVEVTATDAGIKIDKVWVAADVGQIIDPVNFENLVQGGVVFALGHAMNSEITFSDGKVEQANYYDAEGMRLYQCPEIHVRGLELGGNVRGIGEPPVPPAAPALGNAIFAATGQRIREMPFNRHINFV